MSEKTVAQDLPRLPRKMTEIDMARLAEAQALTREAAAQIELWRMRLDANQAKVTAIAARYGLAEGDQVKADGEIVGR